MTMSKWLMTGALSVITIPGIQTYASSPAHAEERSLRWGVCDRHSTPGESIGSGTGRVMGSDRVWTVRRGQARVHVYSGEFYFKVKGLVLASGNGASASDIGTPGAVTQVKGTLVCDLDGSAGNGNSTVTDTRSALLNKRGTVVRSGNMVVPTVCTTEPDNIFLICIVDPASSADQWIAAGVEQED